MIKFEVYPSVRLQAHKLLINSNRLKNVFYCTGNTFIINPVDLPRCKEILTRRMIKLKVVN